MYKQQQSSLKVRPFNHLSSACQAVLYFDWLGFACLANHSTRTELPDARHRGYQMD